LDFPNARVFPDQNQLTDRTSNPSNRLVPLVQISNHVDINPCHPLDHHHHPGGNPMMLEDVAMVFYENIGAWQKNDLKTSLSLRKTGPENWVTCQAKFPSSTPPFLD
jgi:hypothetical protein